MYSDSEKKQTQHRKRTPRYTKEEVRMELTVPENEAMREIFVCEFFQDFDFEDIGADISLGDFQKLADENNNVVFIGDLTLDFPTKINSLGQVVFGSINRKNCFSELDDCIGYKMDRGATYLNDERGTFIWLDMTCVVSSDLVFSLSFVTFQNQQFKERTIDFTLDGLVTGSYKIMTEEVTISFNSVHVDVTAATEFLKR